MKNAIRYTCIIFLINALSTGLFAQRTSKVLPQLGTSPLKDVIKAMTLDEKIKMLVGVARIPQMPPAAAPGTPKAAPIPPGLDMNTLISEGKVAGSAGEGFSVPRLNIPSLVYADGPAGLRIDVKRKSNTSTSYYATAFPVATLLASSWDTLLVKVVGKAIGNEVHAYGVDVLLAPGINIHRNPLTGRNFEYFSEDPLLTGYMASAMINGIQSNGVGTSIKHFAANNQETSRNGIDVIVSERALREIYLRGFQIAISRSQPWTVMSSYNQINGTYASQSHDLLTGILKNEWGFKGFVMTDWWAGHDPIAQMRAGNDLIMPGHPDVIQTLKDAVNNGNLSVEVLDNNLKRILSIALKSPSFKRYHYNNKPDLWAHAQIARGAAAKGMVLLKNTHSTLPIAKTTKNIAIFGNSGYDLIASGTGSGNVNKAYKVSLSEALEQAGYSVNNGLKNNYKTYIATEKAKYPKENFWKAPVIAQMDLSSTQIDEMSNLADAAIISIGRNSGEGEDRKLDADYNLTLAEEDNIQNISAAFHNKGKKVIAVLNIGSVIEIASWRNKVDAILLAWQPGQEGGSAITDILTGAVNPSGKLATTFAVNYDDIPSGKNFPGKPKDSPTEVRYEEGIYVGYRYFNTFHIKPAYEFGFGLSYTSFAYSNLKLGSPVFNNKLNAKVTVTNTGKVAGQEVVQLYLAAPANQEDKPIEELKAFGKTKLLKPGASETLTFTIDKKALASFNSAIHAWVAEAGYYRVKVGASSTDIKQTAVFKLPKELVVERVTKALLPQKQITDLKAKKP